MPVPTAAPNTVPIAPLAANSSNVGNRCSSMAVCTAFSLIAMPPPLSASLVANWPNSRPAILPVVVASSLPAPGIRLSSPEPTMRPRENPSPSILCAR